MTLRDYQEEAVHWLLPRRRALVQAPAGAGKTVIGAQAAALRATVGPIWVPWRTHWVCNTVEQKEQAIKALQDAPFPEGCVYVECAAALPDVSEADLVVVDECHHVPAETWWNIVSRLKPGAILWGLTATPKHEDPDRNRLVADAFGEVFVIDRARIIASGHLVEGKVHLHDVDVPGEFDAAIEAETLLITKQRVRRFPLVSPGEHYRRAKWQVTQQYLQKNEKRNQKIAELARGPLSTLVLVHSIEHGEKLAASVPGSALVHSKVGKTARRHLISGLRDGTLRVLFSSSLADEGLDVPRASVLVLAAGGRSAGKLEQRAGRVLRPFEGKSAGVVHDFLDRGCLFGHAQARARTKVYEKLGYHPEVVGSKYPSEVVTSAAPGQTKMDDVLTGTWDGFR